MLHLIVNPASKKAKETADAVTARLDNEKIAYDVFFSAGKGDIAGEVFRLTQEETTIVAVGGDGTLSEVLSGIAEPEKTILGLIPAGTGNDFAAKANIPQGEKALDLILGSEPKFTDFLDCGEGKRSMNIAGLGIDVDILERRERVNKKGKHMSYFSSLIRSLIKYRPVKMKIISDGEERDYSVLIAAACNGSLFGGGIPICPTAVIDDGKIDLIAVDCPKRILLPFYLIKLMRGKLQKSKIYHRVLCEEAEIFPEGTESVQLDGELIPAKSLHVRVVSGKLRMYRG